MISLIVYGVSQPQGSKKYFKRGSIDANPKTAGWRAAVATAAHDWCLAHPEHEPFDGPLELRAVFFLPRPATARRLEVMAWRRPDVDKLLRSIFDSLTELIWTDDSRVVIVQAEKRYAGVGLPRAEITIYQLEPSGERI